MKPHNLIYKTLRNLSVLLMCLLATLAFSSCSNPDEPKPDPTPDPEAPETTTVLVYAVGSNNLYDNLISDMEEMMEAAAEFDTDIYRVLVYTSKPSSTMEDPTLWELKKGADASHQWVEVKKYDKATLSTDPKRISQVIADAAETKPADHYGLFFWSHGSGWLPALSDHVPHLEEARDAAPVLYSFGAEENGGIYDYTDITELADAIPDGFAEFIWFDACYMSNIETIYQLRNKCRYLIGYPTEIYIEGCCYDRVLPYLMKKVPDYADAAEEVFDWYNVDQRAVTVGVWDMSKIEAVAEACRELYEGVDEPANMRGKYRYSRYYNRPLYDLRQYAWEMAGQNEEALAKLDAALEAMTIYKAASKLDFSFREIPQDWFSGLSTNAWQDDDSEAEDFYRTLDWYKATYNAE